MRSDFDNLSILGIRGIPAKHGGFETFAQKLSEFICARGGGVVVYCQEHGGGWRNDNWFGIDRVIVPVRSQGWLATIEFDVKSAIHFILHGDGNVLVLGYGTGFLVPLLRLFRNHVVVNMDGIEWKRRKWSPVAKCWLWLNEKLAGWFANRLVADHPEIRTHLSSFCSADRIEVIPYGAEISEIDAADLAGRNLIFKEFATVIARPEPENSILEIVRAFSRRKRGVRLVVLGDIVPGLNSYLDEVLMAASDEVDFPGAIYDKNVVGSLRAGSLLYIHGHTVGGTNPSLVEAMAGGAAIIAHDNKFNRWVVGDAALFFSDADSCDEHITRLVEDPDLANRLGESARNRYQDLFQWQPILERYGTIMRVMALESGDMKTWEVR